MLPRQLALPFPHAGSHAAEDFLEAPSNAAALAWLADTGAWPQKRLTLFGPEGAGKTHLLHVWTGRTGALLLDGPGLPALPAPGPAAVDDADLAPERALLHLLNANAERGHPTLLAARLPPARWPVALPDLASRLKSITAAGIAPPEDSLLRALLARLLSDRQLAVPPAVQDWLLLHLPREAAALREAVARIDRLALAAGRRVTRALAAQAVSGLVDETSGTADPAPFPSAPALL